MIFFFALGTNPSLYPALSMIILSLENKSTVYLVQMNKFILWVSEINRQ